MTINTFFGALNPFKSIKHTSWRIQKADRRMVNDLDYVDIKFPVSKRDYCKIEQKIKICINIFCYENDLVYPVYTLYKQFEKCMSLWLITDENKSHYVYIKECNVFMFNKIKNKNENASTCIVCNVFVVKNFART